MIQELQNRGLFELKRRWQSMFEVLRDGGEISPASRLHTEGMMETLVLLEISDRQDLQTELARRYEQCFGESLAQRWGDDWAELFPFPQIPAFGQRAPVYPSTND